MLCGDFTEKLQQVPSMVVLELLILWQVGQKAISG